MESEEVINDSQQGFCKCKLCLKNLVAFYDVTVVVDKGKEINVIYLDVGKGFDTVPYDIIFCRVEKHVFGGWFI